MKTIALILLSCIILNGCGLALYSVAGIPATEYVLNTRSDKKFAIPITGGLVVAHGGITYLLWVACWPAAVAYLGASGIYTIVRIAIEEDN